MNQRLVGIRTAVATACARGLLVLAALALLCAAPARAADRVLSFDELPDNTLLGDQYLLPGDPGQGLRFGDMPPTQGGDFDTRVVTVPAGQAGSPPKVAQSSQSGEFCDVTDSSTWAKFVYARDRVKVLASSPPSFSVYLEGYDLNGSVVASASAVTSTSALKPLEISRPTAEIVWVRVRGLPCAVHRLDNLTFDDLAGKPLPPPDFGLARESGPGFDPDRVGVLKGGSTDVVINVNRVNGSSGPITYAVTGLPTGVKASFPDGVSTSAGKVRIRLTASATAPGVDGKAVQIVATPSGPSVGPGPRSTGIDLDVHGRFDVRIIGMEVTQGIQEQFVPCDKPELCLFTASLPFPPSDTDRTLNYQGVRLASLKQTAVRVFANVKTGDKVEDVTVALRGFRNGKPLKGGPLLSAAKTLEPKGFQGVTWRERTDPNGAFNFILPPDWTEGEVELRAELLLPLNFLGGPAECETSGCAKNNTLRVKGVPFVPTGFITLGTAKLWHKGEDVSKYSHDKKTSDTLARFLPDPPVAFSLAEQLLPLREGGLDYDRDSYYATIEITDLLESKFPFPESEDQRNKRRRKRARERLADYADENPGCAWANFCADSVVGVYASNFTGTGSSGGKLAEEAAIGGIDDPASPAEVRQAEAGDLFDYEGDEHVAVTSYGAPGTGLHEISHGIGRLHGDLFCGGNSDGQVGEQLTADGLGTLDGVGFDLASMRPVAHAKLGSQVPKTPEVWFDYMSYCDGGGWTSAIRWEKNFSLLQVIGEAKGRLPSGNEGPFGAMTARGATSARSVAAPLEPGGPRAAQAAQAANVLRVRATVDSSGAELTSVKPRRGTPLGAAEGSRLAVVARDEAGRELSRTAMLIEETVSDDDATLYFAKADVPAADVVSLELLLDGQVASRRAASENAPKVRVLAPRRSQRAGRRKETTVRWRATDADGDELLIKIDYSINDGRSWEPIHLGPDTGRTRLPSHLFAGSRSARIRVRANDGFHEAAARSARFQAVTRRPSAQIVMPRPRQRVRADETVLLQVQAHDDRRGTIRRDRLITWLDGKRVIARGALASVTGLRAGGRRLRVVVRDGRGGRTSRSVRLRVRPVKARLLALRVPRRLSGRARALTLRIRASVPAQLRITGAGVRRRSVPVARRVRGVRVGVKPGRGRLRLVLRLSSRGRANSVVLVLRRR